MGGIWLDYIFMVEFNAFMLVLIQRFVLESSMVIHTPYTPIEVKFDYVHSFPLKQIN